MLRWALTLLMLIGWLVPSGVSVPLCGCLFRAESAAGCCQEEVMSCCTDADEDTAPEQDCPCSVTAPDQDPGTPPVLSQGDVPAPAVLVLVPGLNSRRMESRARVVEPCARGPCRTVLRL